MGGSDMATKWTNQHAHNNLGDGYWSWKFNGNDSKYNGNDSKYNVIKHKHLSIWCKILFTAFMYLWKYTFE